MATAFSHVHYIEKENIPSLSFPNAEVLTTPEQIKLRKSQIAQAVELGNMALYKVMILFEDHHEVHEVETTIWDADSKWVYLKNGIRIPIVRIHKVDLR